MKCNYYFENSFNAEVLKCDGLSTSFPICHFNVRSARKNLASFENYLSLLDAKLTAIGITETWLQDHDCSLYALEGYHTAEKHRVNLVGGGVAIYIQDHLTYSVRPDVSLFDQDLKSLFVEIDGKQMDNKKNIILGVIYRPPNTDINVFNDKLDNILDTTNKEGKLCYIMGD